MREQLLDRYREEFQGYYEEGKADGAAKAVLLVLAARDIPVSDEQQRRILSCQNQELLDRWTTRAATAGSADEIFADS